MGCLNEILLLHLAGVDWRPARSKVRFELLLLCKYSSTKPHRVQPFHLKKFHYNNLQESLLNLQHIHIQAHDRNLEVIISCGPAVNLQVPYLIPI